MTKTKLGKRSRPTESTTSSFLDKHATNPHNDTLVITGEINSFDVGKILIHSGRSTYVIFLNALLAMRKTKKNFEEGEFPLNRVCGKNHLPSWTVCLPVVFDEGWKTLRPEITLIVVDAQNSCNTILR